MMDKLDKIFEMQDKLNRSIGINLDHLNDEDKTKWILNYSRALQQEVSELYIPEMVGEISKF